MSDLVGRDSITASGIPHDNLSVVMGYGDGIYMWTSADWALFPASIVPLSIVVNAAHAGDILDVERFDATPDDCPGWADRFNRPGRRLPSIYCNRSTIAAVRAAMGSRKFDWWAATLDGTTTDTDGAVAVQVRGSALTGGPYDESIIVDPTWIGGIDLTDEQDMMLRTVFTTMTRSALGDSPPSQTWLDVWAATRANTDELVKAVAGLAAPTVDVTTLVAQLKADPTFLTALADAVKRSFGVALTG